MIETSKKFKVTFTEILRKLKEDDEKKAAAERMMSENGKYFETPHLGGKRKSKRKSKKMKRHRRKTRHY